MAKQKEEKKGPPYAGGSPEKAHTGAVSNRLFANTDQGFIAACEKAHVQPSKRQASKYRLGKGKAYKAK